MKKLITLALVLVLSLGLLSACGSPAATPTPDAPSTGSPEVELETIRVGASITPHAEILAVCTDILAEQGYKLEIVEFTDYVLPNTTLEDGDLDANYFQHLPYLEGFNAERNTHIVSVLAVHYEPMGVYPGQRSSLDEIQEGDTIAVPNDGSNEARALLLLEACGLIKLREGVAFDATKLDIAENPLNLNILELDAANIAPSLPDVAFGVINGNYALQAGLNAGTDALETEAADSAAAQTYANILCVRAGEETTEKTLALVAALSSETVRQYIADTYQGAVIALG